MNIRDIEPRLGGIRDKTLRALEIPDETIDEIDFEEPPDPEMGDLAIPCYALAPHLKQPPPQIAEQLAERLRETITDENDEAAGLIGSIEANGPYVNMSLDPSHLAEVVVGDALDLEDFGGDVVETPEHWMIEYSAPNTNKPQHLGHVRNDLLGESVATIAAFGGHDVERVNLINDRGIHICKSMVAYQLEGDGETPADADVKGDHFVGRYYVRFSELLEEEYEAWQATDAAEEEFRDWVEREREADRLPDELGEQEAQVREAFFETFADDYFNEYSDLGDRARDMLQRWEEGDPEIVELWETMNSWVLDGFEQTYDRLGVEFDHVYYESDTYELGREIVERGLEEGLFERLDDGAVAFDLEQVGLDDQKILLRSDGTTVYMTQDLGTAMQRFREYDLDQMIYVVGDEQDYHFDVLFRILTEIEPSLEGKLHHLSYGMVDLPEGKMKSREGKVVDADDLMDEMHDLAEEAVRERYETLDDDEIERRAEHIGMAALKYHVLDYNPRTRVKFDPEESIDFQGRTGPYCLYSYARIQSIGRRVGGWPELSGDDRAEALRALGTDREMEVVRRLRSWPDTVEEAVRDFDPGEITEYVFELAQSFSSLYNDPDHRIVDLEGPRRDGLLLLARAVGRTLETALSLIGIEVLEEM